MTALLAAELMPPANTLALLVTTESLLFAAFGLTVSLSAPRPHPRWPVMSPRVLAFMIAWVLTCVAIGAASAGVEILQKDGLDSYTEWAQAIGIGAGIVGQPIVAWLSALALD